MLSVAEALLAISVLIGIGVGVGVGLSMEIARRRRRDAKGDLLPADDYGSAGGGGAGGKVGGVHVPAPESQQSQRANPLTVYGHPGMYNYSQRVVPIDVD